MGARTNAAALLLGAAILAGCGGQSTGSLAAGDCFDDSAESLAGEEIFRVPDVDCSEPHDNEVFHVVDYSGSSYSSSAIAEFADRACLAAFEGYVGRDYASSILEASYLIPTADSFSGGDREVVCIVYRMDLAKLTGSVRGSGL